MEKIAYRLIRCLLWCIIVAAFVWFFIRDLNSSGTLTVSYYLCRPSPYISEFSPLGRALDNEKREGYWVQKLVIDPIYVVVRLPQRYDTAAMTVVFQKSDEQPVSAGPWFSPLDGRGGVRRLV